MARSTRITWGKWDCTSCSMIGISAEPPPGQRRQPRRTSSVPGLRGWTAGRFTETCDDVCSPNSHTERYEYTIDWDATVVAVHRE